MSKSKGKRQPYLMQRFGGMGDLMFCTPVIRQLHKNGYDVHVATNDHSMPLLINNPHVAKLWAQPREGVVGMIDGKYPADLTEIDGGMLPTIGLLEHYKTQPERSEEPPLYPYNAVNYFRVIENNSLHEMYWPTQASDFINTYDTHLSWAHIDPMSLKPEDRLPQYYPTKAELDWADKALEHFPRPIIMMQPYASSPVRTFYRITEIVDLLKKRKNATVILWEPSPSNPLSGAWRILFTSQDGTLSEVNRLIPWPSKDVTPHAIRATATLLAKANLLISADTCVSHLAEAVKTFHLTYYTSVPAWTRSRDYKYEFTLDSFTPRSKTDRQNCKCGIIGRDCPRKLMEAFGLLSQRERDIISLLNQQEREQNGIPITPAVDLQGKQPHEFFDTTPQALQEELKSSVSHYESLRQSEAHCTTSLDVAGYLSWVLDSNRFNGGDAECEQ